MDTSYINHGVLRVRKVKIKRIPVGVWIHYPKFGTRKHCETYTSTNTGCYPGTPEWMYSCIPHDTLPYLTLYAESHIKMPFLTWFSHKVYLHQKMLIIVSFIISGYAAEGAVERRALTNSRGQQLDNGGDSLTICYKLSVYITILIDLTYITYEFTYTNK